MNQKISKQKEKFIRSKPHCNIGTIGHVDHGKTTLTAAITKVLAGDKDNNSSFTKYSDIDKHAEERRRGITINAAHIEYETKKRHYTHIDCPGHQDYIKNMIIGAAQMEGVILVVAVTEGPQEQTREHIILAKEVGIPYMIVYCNKLDSLKEIEMKDFVELEIRELVSTYSFPSDLPVIFGSARAALEEDYVTNSVMGTQSIVELMGFVDNYIKQPERPVNDPLLMAIDEIFSISGRGTVVTGKIEKGTINLGNDIEIIGSKIIKTTCTGLEMYHKFLDTAHAGENVGVLIRGVKKEDIKRGNLVIKPGSLLPIDKFLVKVYLLTAEEGGRKTIIQNNFRPQFFFRTASITGSLTIADENVSFVSPGDVATFEVKLIEKAPVTEGLRFAMREGSVTLGAGVIVKKL